MGSILIRKIKNFSAYSVVLWTPSPFVGGIAAVSLPWERKYALLAMICLCRPKGIAWVIMFSWNTTTASGYTKITRNALVMFWYGVANLIAPQLWQAKDGPRFDPAWIVQIVFAFFLAPIAALVIRFVLHRRNTIKEAGLELQDSVFGVIKSLDGESLATTIESNLALSNRSRKQQILLSFVIYG